MDEINNNKAPAQNAPSKATDAIQNRRRRRLLPLAAAGIVATGLPAHWRKPVIDSVLLPAHAQTTSGPIGDPGFSLTELRTVLSVPSGETTPVEVFSRLQLSACNLPPSSTITVDAFAEITPSGEIQVITAASVSTGTGTISSFINVDASTLAVTSIVAAFRFDIIVDGVPFTFTADAAAIGAAAAGTAAPPTC